jgi:flagellar L-ring protein FlgH
MNKAIQATILISLCLSANAGAGSLYQEGNYQPLTSDSRPRRAGDLITVLVYESASATTTANTSAGRDANVGGEVSGPHRSFSAGLKTSNQTEGRGRTQREGKVLAQITVPIQQVMEHGDLIISGEQLLEINNEKQQIKIEGRIRPQDVSDTNVVLSTRIANAKISYIGQGDLSDKQRPAWWQRFLTMFGV